MSDAAVARPAGSLAGTAGPAVNPPLLQAVIRDALRHGGGRVVLRVSAMAPYRRKVARALLQEGALAAGGIVVEGASDDLLLVGAEAARAGRLRQLLDRLLGPGMTQFWSLESDAAAILAYAASSEGGGGEAGVHAPGLAGLDAWLRSVALPRVVRRRVGMLVRGPGQAPIPAFLRLWIARDDLARLLGGLGGDADIVEHAARCLASRLLRAIGDPAQRRALLGPSLPGALHLPVPPAPIGAGGGQGSGGGALVATVGLEAAADPSALAARRAGLAAQGWLLEVEGLDAASLALLAPEPIPADWLRLAWSPALLAPACLDALRRVDPGRLILDGVEGPAALDWALRLGISRMEGRFTADAMPSGRHHVAAAVLGAVAKMGQAPAPRLAP